MSEINKKTCVIVLGMHRSGTSVLAGMLSIVGVDFGKNLIPADAGNTKGYFENQSFVYINEQILKVLNSGWDDLNDLPAGWGKNDNFKYIREQIKGVIKNEFSQSALFGIKDPRLCLLLPLYLEIFFELKIGLKFIVISRNWQEIAGSLEKRDGFDIVKSIKLCEKYQVNIENNTLGQEKINLTFDQLLNQPENSINMLKIFLPQITEEYAAVKSSVAKFLDPGLKHHQASAKNYFDILLEDIQRQQEEIIKLRDALDHQDVILDIRKSLTWRFIKKFDKFLDFTIGKKTKIRRLYNQAVAKWQNYFNNKLISSDPDFLIIGAARSGTKFLYNCLIQHKQIAPAANAELHFFDNNYQKGLDWYRKKLLKKSKKLKIGEATPYYLFHPWSLKRIQKDFPRVKLIVLLRNPVDRAYSHYQLHLNLKRDYRNISLIEAAKLEPEIIAKETEKMLAYPNYYSYEHQLHSYISRGIYAPQIERCLKLFEKEQILIIKSEDLFAETAKYFEKVCNFLDISTNNRIKFDKTLRNQVKYQPLDLMTKKYLADFYQPHNQRLYKLLNRDFGWNEQENNKAVDISNHHQSLPRLSIRYQIRYHQCNLTCPYCIANCRKNENKFDLRKFIQIIDKIKKLPFEVYLRIGVGGEIFTSPDLVNQITLICNENNNIKGLSFSTNLQADWEKIIYPFIKKTDVSKLGIGCTLHDTVIKSVDYFFSKVRLLKENKVLLYVGNVALPGRIDQIKEFKKKCEQIGVPFILNALIGKINNTDKELKYPRDYTIQEMAEFKKIWHTPFSYKMLLEACSPEGMRCSAGKSYIYLNDQGDVYPCSGIMKKMGNILNDKIIFQTEETICPRDRCWCGNENQALMRVSQQYDRTKALRIFYPKDGLTETELLSGYNESIFRRTK